MLYSVACIRKSGVHTNILLLIEIYINEVYDGLKTNTFTMHGCSRYLGPQNIGMPMQWPGSKPCTFWKTNAAVSHDPIAYTKQVGDGYRSGSDRNCSRGKRLGSLYHHSRVTSQKDVGLQPGIYYRSELSKIGRTVIVSDRMLVQVDDMG